MTYQALTEYLKRIINLHPDEELNVRELVKIIQEQRNSGEIMAYHAIQYMAEYIEESRRKDTV